MLRKERMRDATVIFERNWLIQNGYGTRYFAKLMVQKLQNYYRF